MVPIASEKGSGKVSIHERVILKFNAVAAVLKIFEKYEEVQILIESKLNPCTGIFKDFVQNCKAATFVKKLFYFLVDCLHL